MFEIAILMKCSMKFYTAAKRHCAFSYLPICMKKSGKYTFITCITLITGATY